MYDFGYASARTQGTFISQLIVDHHLARQLERGRRKMTHAEIAGELMRLADLLDTSAHDRAVVAAKLVRLAVDLLSE